MDGTRVLRKPEAGGARRASAAVALCVVMLGLLTACGRKSGEAERVNPSGMAVPRYVVLKFDEVNARAGPGDDHKLLWIYHAKGLPLHTQPRDSAAVVAYLSPRAVAGLDKCQKGWCRLRSGQVDGWAPATEIWGADERPQCTGAAPAAAPGPAPAG